MSALFTTAPRTTAQRQAVVLLHASASSARQWDALAERLRTRFDVHALDLHGHGDQAPWPHARTLSLRDEAALVLPILKEAGQAHLVGHSYGGAIAMYIAARYPSRVRSLAVFEPVLLRLLADLDPRGPAIRETRAAFDHIGTLMSGGQAVEAACAFVDHWSGAGTWEHTPPGLRRYMASRMPSVCQQFDIVCRASLPATTLEHLSMPTLCLSGDRTTAAAASIAGLLRSLLPTADHRTLPGMGHMGPVTHAQAVNDCLLCFLGMSRTPHTGSFISATLS